jgi:ectoine hydroxylase-related dioxygenase (phytanoyl-CoA dioxygenase family)
MNSTLSQEDVRYYHENGYLLPKKKIFSAEMQAELTQIFEEHWEKHGRKMNNEHDTPHFRDERLLKYLLHKDVLDLIEPLIGPNIGLWSSHFICKEPLIGRQTPWHEDSSYWNGRLTRFDKIITIWLAIDRSTQENGCMRVIPGTHHNGFSEYEDVSIKENIFSLRIKNIDESKAVYFELEPGEYSLHESRIIHGAKPNTSNFRRCGYTMRYFSTEAQVIPEKNEGHRIWLARGKDVDGRNRFENV